MAGVGEITETAALDRATIVGRKVIYAATVLLWTSSKGGRQLVLPPIIHQPHQGNNSESTCSSVNNSECYSITSNTILRINGLLGHSPVTILLDSGAAMSVVRLDTLPSEITYKITEAKLAPVGANGTPLDVVGQIQIPVKIGTYQTEQVFTVVNTLTVDCLLGGDDLVIHEVIIDYTHSQVSIKGHKIPFTLMHGIANVIHPLSII